MEHQSDIVIIGAGPVGLFAIFEAGMLKMKAHVTDALEALGGQCTALYPEKPIYDIPGFPEIAAEKLIENLAKQAEPFHPTYHLNQRIDKLEKTAEGFKLTTSGGTVLTCRAVILAAGCGAFGPNRPLIANIEAYEGKSIFYAVQKKEILRGKKVVIAGGGDSAVDWAIALQGIAEKIYVVHRRPKFRAAPESTSKLDQLAVAGKVEMVIPYQLDGLEGKDGQLEKVIVATLEGEKKALEADILLPFFGLAMELGPIAEWGLSFNQNHIAVNPATMETNIPGVYAVGDIATYPGKLKLILSGFSEAAMALHAAYERVFPGQTLHFEYSTTKGVQAA